MYDSTPFWIIAVSAIVVGFYGFVSSVRVMAPLEPPNCLEAPEVVRGWHTVSAHPETHMVCGWQTAGVEFPVFRCLKMRECLP